MHDNIRSFLREYADLNGGNIDDAEILRDPSPGPMYRDVYAVRIPGAIDYLVYVPLEGRMYDFEEVEFPSWPPPTS